MPRTKKAVSETSTPGVQPMIVESPAKARTIAGLLGKRFLVVSSMGHIADLPRSTMAIDMENGFEPEYEVPSAKKKVVAELRKATKGAETVWLASDEDREGEAIAWHVARVLKLKPKSIRRIAFHEITKPAILAALENSRTINQDLVDAQQARRVLDRLVGYELSPVLWKKVMTGLSAGRVQSVAVRLVVEREREIDAFESDVSFKVAGEFAVGSETLSAKLDHDFPGEDEARGFLEQAAGARFEVKSVESKPGRKSPRPPFTTSTLQQEASQKLSFSVKQTMALAQRLYEAGRITYMRTDSVSMSSLALKQAAGVVRERFGSDFAQTRQYKTKSKGAQEAHEAIRPTDFRVEEIEGERNQQRLYSLIWRRALASQMAEAQVERTTAMIGVSTRDEKFVAKGEVVTFEGFLKLYGADSSDGEGMLPSIDHGQALEPVEIVARQSFSRPPARYTEASLVRRLEELGIGRPSTYAPTISTIQDRGYVEKRGQEGVERRYRVLVLRDRQVTGEDRVETVGAEKAKLFPTDVAGVVTDFLVERFPEVVDYNFTARVEEQFDSIAAGETAWREMIAAFYVPFHADVEKAQQLSRAEVSKTRELGTDPKSGRPVSVRIGRYGPYVQIGTKDDEEKPRFASLRPGQRMDAIELADAFELFKLPRRLGVTPDGEEVLTNFGRFGPYVKYGDKFVSIKEKDPLEITLEEALEAIAAKKAADAKREILAFDGGIRVLRGRYGPYVTDGTRNARIPKDTDPEKLSLEQCQELLEKAPARKARRAPARKRTVKKTARKAPTKRRRPSGK